MARSHDERYEEWFAKLERLAVSPGGAVGMVRMLLQMDVRDTLPAIRVPTLVLHKRDDKVVPIEEGRALADQVPGATFVKLPGATTSDHEPHFKRACARPPEADMRCA